VPLIPWSSRSIQDFHQRFVNAGLPVFLRLKNSVDDDLPFTTLGFTISGDQVDAGFTDIMISPPPDVMPVNSRNTGIDFARLQFGPHRFIVSHTWVMQRMQVMGYTDPFSVWRDPSVIGFYYNNRLYAIESIQDVADAGEIINWSIIASASEKLVTDE
jgi:hypothetical protein